MTLYSDLTRNSERCRPVRSLNRKSSSRVPKFKIWLVSGKGVHFSRLLPPCPTEPCELRAVYNNQYGGTRKG